MDTIPGELVAWITAAGGLFGSGWLAAIRIVADPLRKRLDLQDAKIEAANGRIAEHFWAEFQRRLVSTSSPE